MARQSVISNFCRELGRPWSGRDLMAGQLEMLNFSRQLGKASLGSDRRAGHPPIPNPLMLVCLVSDAGRSNPRSDIDVAMQGWTPYLSMKVNQVA